MPLLDRIDLHVEAPAVPYTEMRAEEQGVSSAEMRARIGGAREIQQRRGHYNLQLSTKVLRKLCRLDEGGERTLEMAMRRLALSARAHDRIPEVARAIAGLDDSEAVSTKHLAEAVQYRSLDRSYWS